MSLRDVSAKPQGDGSPEAIYDERIRPWLEMVVLRSDEASGVSVDELVLDDAGLAAWKDFFAELSVDSGELKEANVRVGFVGLKPLGPVEAGRAQRYAILISNDRNLIGACVFVHEVRFELSNQYMGQRFYDIRDNLAAEHDEDSELLRDIDELIDTIRRLFYPQTGAEDGEDESKVEDPNVLRKKIKGICLKVGKAAFAILADFERDYRDNEGWVKVYDSRDEGLAGRIGEDVSDDPFLAIAELLVERAKDADETLRLRIQHAMDLLKKVFEGDASSLGELREALRAVEECDLG